MAKFRSIDPSICQSETVAQLSYRQRDLWMRLIVTVDDQGRLSANPTLIRAVVWPYDDIDINNVEEDLRVLENKEFIFIYEVNEKKYLQIRNWQKYQAKAEWLAESKYPAPVGWNDRFRYHGKGRQIYQSENWGETSALPNELKAQIHLLPNNLKTPFSSLPDHDDKEESEEKEDFKEGKINKDEGRNQENDKKMILNTKTHLMPSEEELKVWNMTIGELQKEGLSRVDYDTYIKHLELVGVENNIYTIRAINRFTANLVKTRYGGILNKSIQGFSKNEVKIDFIV
jgi:hypothetical protein